MKAKVPRILITAPKSGTGKTLITCGILKVLKQKGLLVQAFKCGPDYIDPMFHKEVLGISSYNLDTFLCGKKGVYQMLANHALKEPGGLAVLEGVMGYFDGLAGISTEASSYDVADVTDTPAVLVVDAKGVSLSIVPYIQGFLKYKDKDGDCSHIKGVILNRISPAMYARMKEVIERETPVKVYGYVPVMKDVELESRHLGLKMPGEVERLQEKLEEAGTILKRTLDIEGLLALAHTAPEMNRDDQTGKKQKHLEKVRIGVAKDEAFCFLYEDNLTILKNLGAELVYFSPVHDRELPEDLKGLILYGGYPELYGQALSENQSMRKSVKRALEKGIVCIAECGGFQYLQESLTDQDGKEWSMTGVLKGRSFYTPSLRRFGYVSLSGGTIFGKYAEEIPAHEFHYYDSEICGASFKAKKPMSDRTWECIVSTDTLFAGYPHFHYAGAEKIAEAFLERCRKK